jgi:hypothetical protein
MGARVYQASRRYGTLRLSAALTCGHEADRLVTMSETKTYPGGCHCGKVRYEATTDLGMVISCNCSMCSKKGTFLTFIEPSAMKVLAGDGEQSVYHFNKHVIDHLFCKTCGVTSYATGKRPDGKEMVAINVRCLEGVDLASLKTTQHDGKSR